MLAVEAGIRCTECLRDLHRMHIPSVLVILLVTKPTLTQRKLFLHGDKFQYDIYLKPYLYYLKD
jgi:hypothetical protein